MGTIGAVPMTGGRNQHDPEYAKKSRTKKDKKTRRRSSSGSPHSMRSIKGEADILTFNLYLKYSFDLPELHWLSFSIYRYNQSIIANSFQSNELIGVSTPHPADSNNIISVRLPELHKQYIHLCSLGPFPRSQVAAVEQAMPSGRRELQTGRFAPQPRMAETPRTTISGTNTTAAEEGIYKFFAGEFNMYFDGVNDQVLFVKVLHSDGIDSSLDTVSFSHVSLCL